MALLEGKHAGEYDQTEETAMVDRWNRYGRVRKAVAASVVLGIFAGCWLLLAWLGCHAYGDAFWYMHDWRQGVYEAYPHLTVATEIAMLCDLGAMLVVPDIVDDGTVTFRLHD